MKVLEIGAGGNIRSKSDIGQNIDLTVLDARVDEFTDVLHEVQINNHLPFADETFDAVYSAHILEHIPYRGEAHVVTDWARVLKPGGKLITIVPSWEWVAEQVLMDPKKRNRGIKPIAFAGQINEWDYHHNMFTLDMLAALYKHAKVEVRNAFRRKQTYIVFGNQKVRMEENYITGIKK